MKLNIVILFVMLGCLQACTAQTRSPKETAAADTIKRIVRTEAEWRKILTPEQFHILRQKGTDMPFTGKYYLHKEKGVYQCAGCHTDLFTSDMKFESDCGWPSFDKEIEGGKIKKITDTSHGMIRTEIVCTKCGAHLGHLFDDGPTLTGQRYCVNSTSIDFKKKE